MEEIEKLLREEGMQYFSKVEEGFLSESAARTLFAPSTSYLGRVLRRAEEGDARSIVLSGIFLDYMARHVELFGETEWEAFVFDKIAKSNILPILLEKRFSEISKILSFPVETPLGIKRTERILINNGNKTEIFDQSGKLVGELKTTKPPFPFLKPPFAVCYETDSIEPCLYFSDKKGDMNLSLASVVFIVDEESVYSWNKRVLSLSSSPLVALCQAKKRLDNVIFGGIKKAKNIPWHEILLNTEFAKEIIPSFEGVERTRMERRIENMKRAKRIGVYMMNFGGDAKMFNEERKRRERAFNSEVIVSPDFIEFFKKEGLKEGVDYIISGGEIVAKLSTIIGMGMKRMFSQRFYIRLSYDERGENVKNDIGASIRTASIYRNRAFPGDVIVMGQVESAKKISIAYANVFEGDRIYVNKIFNILPTDMFLGFEEDYRIERIGGRVLFNPEEEI
ncbi:MAG: hypothetical protein QXL47_00815 [Candidatus Anstonellales archaeon]